MTAVVVRFQAQRFGADSGGRGSSGKVGGSLGGTVGGVISGHRQLFMRRGPRSLIGDQVTQSTVSVARLARHKSARLSCAP